MYLSQCSLGFLLPTQPNTTSIWLKMVANKKNAALKQISPSVRQCSELVYRCKRQREMKKTLSTCHPICQECGKIIILMYCRWKYKLV